ncbi:cytochrome c4 [Oceanospirillaceae bacterium]|jgi:cytochrome c553|uniref:c-type cytochrome n=1 Tax=Candidatus Njordibacter sp. Uisw_058 TaxID=3230974 RepID=UPI000E83D7A6|nr:cytochrome c4 [Oceanospirillaceae bacterium]MBT4998314.1 cytochrome c4 [Oceanospirillaceae bacterium]MBT5628977.1 cytochrome c4 [Oceanospirillaceae bacterium]MBT6102193.1 cytochrome c4 [Oceanospirillaceae bacterium]MDB0065413.1 cytochrome c4 [Oceanospirillaceae bacterium]|tara:strand:- start:7 stop:612 length:606 start_codon:yes stop_codon:yes gene_type:complete
MKKLIVCMMVGLGWMSFAYAAGDAASGQGKVAVCSGCHGADGNSMIPSFPKLAGQGEVYLVNQLKDIRDGARNVPQMMGILTGRTDQDLADMAAFYSTQKVTVGATNPDLLDLGRQIYRAGIAEKGVAACTACHSPTGAGNAQAGFPAVGGQHADYLISQLKAYRTETRTNGQAKLMQQVAALLSDKEIEAVASYMQGLSE